VAVDHVSFQVNQGELLGFLGPNGAGKTTAIRMLAGIIKKKAVKLASTIIFVALMGFLIERLIEWTDNKRIGVSQEVEK